MCGEYRMTLATRVVEKMTVFSFEGLTYMVLKCGMIADSKMSKFANDVDFATCRPVLKSVRRKRPS